MRRTDYPAESQGLVAGQVYLISSQVAGPRAQLVARVTCAVLVAGFLATLPFRQVQLARVDAFAPIDNTLTLICSVITATLLYGQYAVARHRALLALACGYLFPALLVIPHTLIFPGLFASDAALGAYLQSAPWLVVFRQIGILAGFLAYALLRASPIAMPPRGRSVAGSIMMSLGFATALALLVTVLTIAEARHLPPIMVDVVQVKPFFRTVIGPSLIVLSFGAVVVFWKARTSILDLWVQVATVSWVLQVWLMAIVPARYSLVHYVGRGMGMVTVIVVLIALVAESVLLHSRVAHALAARDQERAGRRTAMAVMMSAISHELRQPLTAIVANSEAGMQMLGNAPGSEDTREVLVEISSDARRAAEILASVRSQFAPSPNDYRWVDANDLVRRTIKANQMDLDAREVVVRTHLAPDLPAIRCHSGQLLQVLINGLTNAMEALSAVSDRPRQIRVRTISQLTNGISILIEDSGDGIDDRVKDVFEPFHSTKASGMGLGLLISRSIVEAHGGALSLANGPGGGAVFRVDLPLDSYVDPHTLRGTALESMRASTAVAG